jgi:hypothetical protein
MTARCTAQNSAKSTLLDGLDLTDRMQITSADGQIALEEWARPVGGQGMLGLVQPTALSVVGEVA